MSVAKARLKQQSLGAVSIILPNSADFGIHYVKMVED